MSVDRVVHLFPRMGDEVMVNIGVNQEDGSPWLEFLYVLGVRGDKARLSLGSNTTFTTNVDHVEVVRRARRLKPIRWR